MVGRNFEFAYVRPGALSIYNVPLFVIGWSKSGTNLIPGRLVEKKPEFFSRTIPGFIQINLLL